MKSSTFSAASCAVNLGLDMTSKEKRLSEDRDQSASEDSEVTVVMDGRVKVGTPFPFCSTDAGWRWIRYPGSVPDKPC